MATTAKAPITAETFLGMDLGSGGFELVRGEVVEVPRAMPLHGLVCMNIAFALTAYGRETGLGYVLTNDSAVLTERDPDTVRGADVCFYSEARWPRAGVGSGLPPVAPDLVVEVVSPGNRQADILRKAAEFLNAGALMVWLAYPTRRKLAVYRPNEDEPMVLSETDTLEGLPELPGFRCPVSEFFR